jgi:hypothetical protein
MTVMDERDARVDPSWSAPGAAGSEVVVKTAPPSLPTDLSMRPDHETTVRFDERE